MFHLQRRQISITGLDHIFISTSFFQSKMLASVVDRSLNGPRSTEPTNHLDRLRAFLRIRGTAVVPGDLPYVGWTWRVASGHVIRFSGQDCVSGRRQVRGRAALVYLVGSRQKECDSRIS